VDWRAAVRPAIVVGAVFETVALFLMGRSTPLQGNWTMGVQLFFIFLVPAGVTWLFIMVLSAPKRPH
jgi:hypothetical protein